MCHMQACKPVAIIEPVTPHLKHFRLAMLLKTGCVLLCSPMHAAPKESQIILNICFIIFKSTVVMCQCGSATRAASRAQLKSLQQNEKSCNPNFLTYTTKSIASSTLSQNSFMGLISFQMLYKRNGQVQRKLIEINFAVTKFTMFAHQQQIT